MAFLFLVLTYAINLLARYTLVDSETKLLIRRLKLPACNPLSLGSSAYMCDL